MKKGFFIFYVFYSLFVYGQQETWAYLRARDMVFNPKFSAQEPMLSDGFIELKYVGSDVNLATILAKYRIKTFKKTYKNATKENLKKTFFVVADSQAIVKDLLENASHLFEYGEIIAPEDRRIFEPNDYGFTSTIADRKGLPVNLDYYDFIDLPKAWYYTTGSRDVIIGISDGLIDTTDIEFRGKTKVIRKSIKAKGHGDAVAATAAAQGNNGYGFSGVCSDCSIYGTTYGNFKTLSQLVELSNMGVRVINCSWGSRTYYQTAQDAIDEMFENGTVLVAAAHNRGWDETKGEVYFYPASYDHVISVSSVMHKYATPQENIKYEIDKNNKPYVENIRGYVGRTAGFINDDINGETRIYAVSTKTLNSEVDILGPSTGLFRYGHYLQTGEIDYTAYAQTSGVTPMVSGTIGLMLSLYPCLPTEMIEPILKLTATNIDGIKANQPFAGNYGAGSLNAGRAVKLTHDLFNPAEEAVFENQSFTRWDFPMVALSRKLTFKNQTFKDAAALDVRAHEQILLSPGTVLRPNEEGVIYLSIDETLTNQCELRKRAQ